MQQTCGRKTCPSGSTWSFQSSQGLRRGCSTLTSWPAGTIKDLYEAAYDLWQGGLGWWCLFMQILQDLASLSMCNDMVWMLIGPSAQACYTSERWEGYRLHSLWDDTKRTRFICHWSIDSWQTQSLFPILKNKAKTLWSARWICTEIFRTANQWVRRGDRVGQGVKHAYQCFHPKQLQPCIPHKPACDWLESLSFSMASLRQLLHALAHKEKLWERKHAHTCSQMEGGYIHFLNKKWTLSVEKNTQEHAERKTWQVKKFYSWCWHYFTRQLGPYSENLKT